MKIKDIMHTSFLSFQKDTPIKEVARSLFFTGTSSAPILDRDKLVGIISDEDIVEHMYPTIQGIYKDVEKRVDINWMESHFLNLLDKPVKKIMTVKVTTLNPDSLVKEAQSILLRHNFMRIPVVDYKEKVVGIVSQIDMFRELMSEDIPVMELERYAGFVAENYDAGIDWKKRFGFEFPSLFRIFEKNRVKTVLDIGSWTGEYAIGLAKHGYAVTGSDHNPQMFAFAERKRKKLSAEHKKNIQFVLTDFTNISKVLKQKFDAAISMGNSLPYLPVDIKNALNEVKKLLKDDGVLVLQTLNMNRVIDERRQLLNFELKKEGKIKKRLVLEFFERAQEKNSLVHNVVTLESDGKSWIYKGVNSITIKNITKDSIEKILKDVGFKNISFSGNKGEVEGQFGQMSLVKPFDPRTSEWMTVIAYK